MRVPGPLSSVDVLSTLLGLLDSPGLDSLLKQATGRFDRPALRNAPMPGRSPPGGMAAPPPAGTTNSPYRRSSNRRWRAFQEDLII